MARDHIFRVRLNNLELEKLKKVAMQEQVPATEVVRNLIKSLPDPSVEQSDKGLETFILSESSLSKDWLSPEEDEAWQDL